VPVVEGYRFTGWYDAESSGNPIALGVDGTRLTGQTTLHATWIVVPDTLTVTFDQNKPGGANAIEGTMPDTQQGIPYNGTTRPDLPSPVIESYHFTGWVNSLDSSADTVIPGVTRLVWDTESPGPHDQTWHATWKLQPPVTVTFDPDVPQGASSVAGTVPGTQTNQIYNTRISPTSPIVEGHRFDGWTISSQDQTINGTPFDPVVDRLTMDKFTTPTSDTIALVATWAQMPAIDLVFDPNPPTGGGMVVASTVPPTIEGLPYHSPVAAEPTPVPLVDGYSDTGYRFAGWYTAADGGTQITFGPDGTRIVSSPVYAHWIVDTTTYSITWSPDDDDASRAVNVPTNNQDLYYSAPLAPPDSQILRQGHQFAGWWTSTGGTGGQIVFSGADQTRIIGNTTLHAAWTPDVTAYTVFFDSNASEDPSVVGMPSTRTRAVSEPIGEPGSIPVRPGYSFTGWWYECDPEEGICSKPFTPTDRIPDPGQNVTVYAGWTLDEATYTVTFDPNAGDDPTVFGVPEPKGLSVSDVIRAPSSVIGRIGYEFGGWWYECGPQAECTDEFQVTDRIPDPGQNVTLHARWTENPATYDVVYHANAEEDPTVRGLPVNNQDLQVSGLTSPPGTLIAREGYRFDGWYRTCTTQTACEGPVALGTIRIPDPGADINVYAKWIAESPVEIEFAPNTPADAEVTDMPPTAANIPYDAVMPETTTPVALATDDTGGYEFLGWWTDQAAGVEYQPGTTRILQDTTLYARWATTPSTVAVTFTPTAPDQDHPLVPGTMPTPIPTLAYSAVLPADLATPAAEGYRFTGWHDSANPASVYAPGSTRVYANVTLAPEWRPADPVEVTFDANEPVGLSAVPGTVPTPVANQVLNAPLVTGIPTPIVVGYRFTGWYSAAIGGIEYIPGTTLVFTSADGVGLTVHAQWEEVPDFEVGIDCEATSSRDVVPGTCPAGWSSFAYNQELPAEISSPIAVGYSFQGWYTASVGGARLEPGVTRLLTAATLHARWKSEPAFPVVFVANIDGGVVDGTMPAPILTHPYNDLLPASLREPLVLGRSFAGWYDNADANGSPYVPGETRIRAGVALYAAWNVEAPVSVTFTAGEAAAVDGTLPGVISQVPYHGTVTPPAQVPIAIGHVFDAWYADGEPFDFAGTRLTGNLTLEAQWTAVDNVSVRFEANVPGDTEAVAGSIPETYVGAYQSVLPASLPTPIAPGYRWMGWYTAPSGGSASTPGVSRLTGDTEVLYAQWEAMDDLQVGYNAKKPAGTVLEPGTTPEPDTVRYHAAATRPSDPVALGYQFAGWYTTSALVTEFDFAETRLETDTFLYGRWIQMLAVDVSFDLAGVEPYAGAPSTVTAVAYSARLADPGTPHAVGREFVGWFNTPDDDGPPVDFATYRVQSVAPVTLHARWDILPPVEVSFMANLPAGAGVTASTMPADIPDAQIHELLPSPAETPTAVGWRFTFWSTDPAGTLPYYFGMTRLGTDGVTLYANWTAITVNSVTVAFSPNAPVGVTVVPGTFPAPTSVLQGTVVLQPSPPEATGAEFAGWSSTPGTLTSVDFGQAILTDTTVFAIWTVKTPVAVQFDANGVSAMPGSLPAGSGAVVYNTTIAEPTVVPVDSATAMQFDGWYSSQSPGPSDDPFDFSQPIRSDATIILYAAWTTLPHYDVTFDPGTDPTGDAGPTVVFQGASTPAQSIASGHMAERPETDPAAEGWRFVGWYTEASGGIPHAFESAPMTTTTVLHAQWIPMAPIAVAFQANVPAGTVIPDTMPATTTVPYNATIPEPVGVTPGLEGYEFAGWYATPAGASGGSAFVFAGTGGALRYTASVNIFASWTARGRLSVAFDAGTVASGPVQLVPGTLPGAIASLAYNATLPGDIGEPAAIGHLFAGWASGALPVTPGETRLTADSTLTAQWAETVTTVPVTFDPSGHFAQGMPEAAEVLLNETLTIAASAAPVTQGYRFDGWALEPDGPVQDPTTLRATTPGGMTLHARWTAMPNPRITFDPAVPEGAEAAPGTVPAPLDIPYGTLVTRPVGEPTVEGYRFTGWYADARGEQLFAFADDVGASPALQDTTVHAGWEVAAPISVTFVAGTIGEEPADLAPGTSVPDTIEVAYGAVLPAGLVAPRVIGHRFAGWSDGAGPVVPGETRLTAPTTLTATWGEDPVEIEVTFAAGGPAGVLGLPDAQRVPLSGVLDVADLGTPVAVGQEFAGWSATAGGSVIVDLDSYRIEPAGDSLTIYAAWVERESVTVSLDSGDRTVISGMPAGGGLEVPYNGTVELPALVGLGAAFDAWTTCPTGPDAPAVDFMTTRVVESVTVCARWGLAAQIPVTFQVGVGPGAGDTTVLVDLNGKVAQPADPVVSGQTFTGWYADAALSVPFAFASTRVTRALTVYAAWTPTDRPTVEPTDGPTDGPTVEPTDGPTVGPTVGPTDGPTVGPTDGPTGGPTDRPTDGPTGNPTNRPTDRPGGGDPGRTGDPGGNTPEPGQDNPAPDEVPSRVVAAIVIAGAPSQVSLPGRGTSTVTLNAQVSPPDATIPGVTWAVTSGPASVDGSGTVTFAGAEGDVTVQATATDGSGTQATATMEAVRAVGAIRTPVTKLFIQSGKKLTLPVAIDDATDPTTTTTANLTFASSNTKVAAVDAKGVIKAAKTKKNATATITVKARNGKTLAVKVTVVPKAKKLTKLTVKGMPGKNTLKIGKSAKLTVGLAPKDATGAGVSFASSSSSVLRVDKSGKITALKKGKATITIKAAGKAVKTKPITVK
jgi:uncharacterized repeat protein (TIGR02543 family)